MLDDDHAIHVYEVRGGKLCVGVRGGETRPSLWAVNVQGEMHQLGRLDGLFEVGVVVGFLDAAFDDINRVIEHYKTLNGDSTGG